MGFEGVKLTAEIHVHSFKILSLGFDTHDGKSKTYKRAIPYLVREDAPDEKI